MKKEVLSEAFCEMLNKIEKFGYNSLDINETLFLAISITDSEIDAKMAAKKLLEKFSSLAKIFNADAEELLEVVNLKENTISLFRAIPHFATSYFESLNVQNKKVHNTEEAYKHFQIKLLGKKHECVAVIILSSSATVVFEGIVWEGTFSQVPIYVRDLLLLCLKHNANSLIIAHNHPSGNPMPSKGDVASTRELQLALDSIYVYLQDHMIITDEHYLSMRNSGWMSDLNKKLNEFRQGMMMDAKLLDEEYGFVE
ncbi:MAG: JAB domain-containing protein [Clostridia bacterium]